VETPFPTRDSRRAFNNKQRSDCAPAQAPSSVKIFRFKCTTCSFPFAPRPARQDRSRGVINAREAVCVPPEMRSLCLAFSLTASLSSALHRHDSVKSLRECKRRAEKRQTKHPLLKLKSRSSHATGARAGTSKICPRGTAGRGKLDERIADATLAAKFREMKIGETTKIAFPRGHVRADSSRRELPGDTRFLSTRSRNGTETEDMARSLSLFLSFSCSLEGKSGWPNKLADFPAAKRAVALSVTVLAAECRCRYQRRSGSDTGATV